MSVNGDLGHPQPVYLRNNSYAVPTGTTGVIHFTSGEQIHLACTGSSRTIVHPNITTTVASAVSSTIVYLFVCVCMHVCRSVVCICVCVCAYVYKRACTWKI